MGSTENSTWHGDDSVKHRSADQEPLVVGKIKRTPRSCLQGAGDTRAGAGGGDR